MINAIVFYSVSFLLILFALLTIKFENIAYSLLSAVVVFFITGVIFYLLGSEYNAIIQIAIYGIAVPVILGLAIMFTERSGKFAKERYSNFTCLIIFISILFTLALVYLAKVSSMITQNTFHILERISGNATDNLIVFAHGIFTKYILAFEFVGIILLIILAGLTIFKKELKK